MYKKNLLLIIFFSFLLAQAQNENTLMLKDTSQKEHSPHKATMLALIPGMGQAYNKKYWKMPIVYVGLGALGYSAYFNNKNANEQTKAIVYRNDNNGALDPYFPNKSITQLRADRDYYLGNRDVSIIGFLVVYGLQIVDAAVDAHLYKFNVNKSISINLLESKPTNTTAVASIVLKF